MTSLLIIQIIYKDILRKICTAKKPRFRYNQLHYDTMRKRCPHEKVYHVSIPKVYGQLYSALIVKGFYDKGSTIVPSHASPSLLLRGFFSASPTPHNQLPTIYPFSKGGLSLFDVSSHLPLFGFNQQACHSTIEISSNLTTAYVELTKSLKLSKQFV